jgi:hypothetical protein
MVVLGKNYCCWTDKAGTTLISLLRAAPAVGAWACGLEVQLAMRACLSRSRRYRCEGTTSRNPPPLPARGLGRVVAGRLVGTIDTRTEAHH